MSTQGPIPGQVQTGTTRRDFLQQAGGGLGALSRCTGCSSKKPRPGRLGRKGRRRHATGHFPAKAQSVIYLFMHGGPSHLETFDPKPDLQRAWPESPCPPASEPVATRRKVAQNPLLATRRTFRRCGQSGIEISDFLPHLYECADDLAVIRSCWADSVNHPQAVYEMNTGSILMGKPSLGSWVSYGLGTENQDLPSFLVLPDPGGGIKGGPPAYGAGFLPASHQGTLMRGGDRPILDLLPPAGAIVREPARRARPDRPARPPSSRRARRRPRARGPHPGLRAGVPHAKRGPRSRRPTRETDETRRLYGLDEPRTAEFGTRCLLARRLVERGVRFVQLYSGDVNGWDAHDDVEANHATMCGRTDKPVAGLLKDLKRRGLLESTLVIWGGEFGRMPMSESRKGRDHNPHGFCYWMAGGGVKGGTIHGATDAVGLRALVDRVHVHDLHATILHLLGLDHTRLTFPHNGRDDRLTDTAGTVIRSILA